LSRAAEKGNKAVVELLLENGAQPDLEDAGGKTPLSRALRAGNVNADVVRLLSRALRARNADVVQLMNRYISEILTRRNPAG